MPAGATYEPIATTTLGSGQSSITFSSISSSYTDLRLIFFGYSVDTNIYGAIRFNGDTGTNYSVTYMAGNSSAASSSRLSNQTYLYLHGTKGMNNNGNNNPAMLTADIFSYAGNTNKTVLTTSSNTDQSNYGAVERGVGLWRSTSAINSITMVLTSFNFATGATATLYGIARA
jgi:WD40 repeat protein